MTIIGRIWRWLDQFFTRRERRLCTAIVDDLPVTVRDDTVYIVGENGHYWCVVLACPCGCRALIQLNLVKSTKPCWSYDFDEEHTLSLHPSVWRTDGCRSHFFLRQGRIEGV